MFTAGQDVFISAAIVRLFKEDIELHTVLAQFMKEGWEHTVSCFLSAASSKKELSRLIISSI